MSKIYSRDAAKRRAYQALLMRGIDRDRWIEETGFSKDQYYKWYNPNNSTSVAFWQVMKVCNIFDINPMWVAYGEGPQRISTLRKLYAEHQRKNEAT